VFNGDHGAPVESVLLLPTGGVFLSAGMVLHITNFMMM
jgi:hypothetical protein